MSISSSSSLFFSSASVIKGSENLGEMFAARWEVNQGMKLRNKGRKGLRLTQPYLRRALRTLLKLQWHRSQHPLGPHRHLDHPQVSTASPSRYSGCRNADPPRQRCLARLPYLHVLEVRQRIGRWPCWWFFHLFQEIAVKGELKRESGRSSVCTHSA